MKKKNIVAKRYNAVDFFASIPDETTAREYLENARWPIGITCIHCGHNDVWKISGRRLYTCKSCRKQFTICAGTVMENSHIKIQKWIYAIYLMTVSRQSISSIQLAKKLGVTQKSAWHLARKLRDSVNLNHRLSNKPHKNRSSAFFANGKKFKAATFKAGIKNVAGP